MEKNLENYRKSYDKSELKEENLLANPLAFFQKWFNEAQSSELTEPNAMIVGTSDNQGFITQRTVLLKAFDKKGFVFYTNYGSRKARQIEQNNKVSLLFPWFQLERQVAVTGIAEKVSTAESMKYFMSRPFGSQLGAWVSNQSQIITSRNILEVKLHEMKEKFKEGKVPLPDFWGGYRVIPNSIEFWQGRPSRLHDRILYSNENGQWKRERLSP